MQTVRLSDQCIPVLLWSPSCCSRCPWTDAPYVGIRFTNFIPGCSNNVSGSLFLSGLYPMVLHQADSWRGQSLKVCSSEVKASPGRVPNTPAGHWHREQKPLLVSPEHLSKKNVSFHSNTPVIPLCLCKASKIRGLQAYVLLFIPHTVPVCIQVLKRCTSAGAPHLGSSVPRKYLGDFSIMVPSKHFITNLQVLECTLMALRLG